MKLLKIIALVLIISIPLNLLSEAHAGLWTDLKAGFKKFYSKFRKDAQSSAEAIKKDPGKIGRDAAHDAKRAGAQIRDSSREMGRSLNEGAKSVTKELKNTFRKAKNN